MRKLSVVMASVGVAGMALVSTGLPAASADASWRDGGTGLPPSGAIQHVLVVDLENESYGSTFGSTTPSYLTTTLVPQGTLIPKYFAVGHVSADNYLAQVSGQAPNLVTNSDCVGSTGAGSFNDVLPGTLDADQATYPGQVDGQGCVFPASVQTIGGQLSRSSSRDDATSWREYAEDMGNDPIRDGGVADKLGGTDCAHPVQTNGTGTDPTNSAEGPNATGSQVKSTTTDQYADRHNPFVYFHSVIDDKAACNREVVPLGTVTVGTGGAPDTFHSRLADDLRSPGTTPAFAFVTPNLCNDGHDSTCAGTNTAGGTAGGLSALNLWLSHWMPLIMNSPAYRSGRMLVVITADEGGLADSAAGGGAQAGPNNANPGYSPLLNAPVAAFGGKTYYQLLGVTGLTPNVAPPAGTMPGGGQIGALVLNPKWVRAATIDTTGSYNHYSALRTYEDLLGIRRGGADGKGHLGFAATATDFGSDVFVTRSH